MTDAAHLLVDFFSFIISLLSLWLSSRPATHRLNYGWHRAGSQNNANKIYIFNSCYRMVVFSPCNVCVSLFDFIQQVPLSALTQLRCCSLLTDAQRSWALYSQFSLSGW